MAELTILIVEDHAESLDYLTTLLQYREYRVIGARNAVDGLAAARASVPDLIVTDVLMPDCDGYEFTRRLRADSITANIPIIFWTASYGRRGSAILLAENFGVECVLAKPTEPQELLTAVQNALKSPERSRGAVAEEVLQEHTRLLTNHILGQVEGLDDISRLDHFQQHLSERLTVLRTHVSWSLRRLDEQEPRNGPVKDKLQRCLGIVDEMSGIIRRLADARSPRADGSATRSAGGL